MEQPGKILVTGGAGFIGSHTVVVLQNAGFDPVIVDNFSNSDRGAIDGLKNILERPPKVYEGDCADEVFLKDVFKIEKNISGAIHFAAYKSVGESVEKPLSYYRNNINSLLTLIQVMNQHEVSDLVFSSSCTVYGQADSLPVTEKTPVKTPESTYGRTKQICEDIIFDECKRIKTQLNGVILRYFNPIGAHPSGKIGELPIGAPSNLVPFITQTAAGIRKHLTVFGDDYNTPDGTCIRDYIHVMDLASAHVRALDFLKNTSHGNVEVFNLGTGRGNSVMEVIKSFEKVSGEKLNYMIGDRRPGDVIEIYADVAKAKEILGWEAERSLEDSLKDAWNWQKELSHDKQVS